MSTRSITRLSNDAIAVAVPVANYQLVYLNTEEARSCGFEGLHYHALSTDMVGTYQELRCEIVNFGMMMTQNLKLKFTLQTYSGKTKKNSPVCVGYKMSSAYSHYS
jgi:hypothetical protein